MNLADSIFVHFMEIESIVKEGWAVKESGQAVLGQTNWRRRWCRLVRGPHGTSWSYYRWFSIDIISKFLVFFGTFVDGGKNISLNEYLMQVKCFYLYDHGL